MKVYQLRLIMGKATNYDQSGKLKNHVMTVKYAGELELENILEDQNWKKLGACEISCVDVYDSDKPSVSLKSDMYVINARINADVQSGIKPKTEIELLKEQNETLNAKLDSLILHAQNKTIEETEAEATVEKVNKPVITVTSNDGQRTVVVNDNPTEKELREFLFTEAKELGLKPRPNVKTDILKDLIANAKKVKV